ncbi:hypothetical protein Tco_1240838 [Tanacetum coccineum]
MASHHLNPRYAIKECSTCERLYTKECCSIGSLKDKIFVPEPDSSPRCARCGTPVDGPSCRGCAFLRKKFDEDLLAYCVENFQNTSESSDDNTNVVNALREPCVVNPDPGVKFSQEPPQIDHNCCYECGDSLDGIFCRQCICKSCGKGAHYGYNCPPKDPIISKPEPCNQTINEIPQTLPSLDPSCYSLPHVSKPNFVDNSPNFSYPPPQPQFETYLCELCGNNAHYGYDCSPQFQFVHEQEPCYNQNFSPHYDYQCQPINETYYEPNSSYDSSGFDQPQPPQDSVDHQGILQVLNKMEEKFEEIIRDRRKKIEDMGIEEMMHKQQLVNREIKEIINDLGYKIFRGEEIDEEYERDSITPDLPIEEPDNSLSMGDEYLDTTPSIENLIPIPSEFEGMSDDTSDVPTCDNNCVNVESDFVKSLINRDTSIVYSSKIDPILEEFAGELAHIAPISSRIIEADFDPDDDTSINSAPDRVLESPSPFPIPVVDSDSFLEESDTSLSHLDNSLPEFETFSDHTEETRSGSTTTHANYSLPEYDSFLFDIEPDQEGLIPETIPSHLSFGLFSRFSPTPRPLLYLAPPGVKIRSLTLASPLRAGGFSSGWNFHVL